MSKTPTIQVTPVSEQKKPTIIGIYGVSGCGKTTVVQQLEKELGTENFAYFDGSAEIEKCLEGGLEKFKSLSEEERYGIREAAITSIRQHCANEEKVGIVSGHMLFWDYEHGRPGTRVWTDRKSVV